MSEGRIGDVVNEIQAMGSCEIGFHEDRMLLGYNLERHEVVVLDHMPVA